MNRVLRRSLQAFFALIILGVLGAAIYWSTRPVLRLYVWEGYLPRNILWNYQWKRQVRIEVVNFRSNAELLASLKLSWGEFDVIMPSNYAVDEMRRRGLLIRLMPSDIPEIARIDPRFLRGKTTAERQEELEAAAQRAQVAEARRKSEALATTNQAFESQIFADKTALAPSRPLPESGPAVMVNSLEARLQVEIPAPGPESDDSFGDPDNAEYGLPYLYNYAGIGYRASPARGEPPVASWADLFDPQFARRLGNRVAFLDEPRETMGLVLLALGLSPNTQSETDLEALRQRLIAIRDAAKDGPRFVGFEGRTELLAGNIDVLSTWSPEVTAAQIDAIAASGSASSIGYFLPPEGSILTYDTLAIPRSSRSPKLAKDFIRYLLSPEVATEVSRNSYYAHTLLRTGASDPLEGTPSRRRPDNTVLLQGVGEAEHRLDAIWNEFRPRSERRRDAEVRDSYSEEDSSPRISDLTDLNPISGLTDLIRGVIDDAAFVLTGPSMPDRRD
jgi:spermidine/putrescine-binding protein